MGFYYGVSCILFGKFVVNVVCFCLLLSSHGIEAAREMKVEMASHDHLHGLDVSSVLHNLQQIRLKLVANGIGLTPQMG